MGNPPHVAWVDQLGGFIQDDWRVGSRLTLNLGVRYEEQHMKSGRGVFVAASNDEVLSPRHQDAFTLEEHVLGARQADAGGAELARDLRFFGRVGVGADAELAELVRPAHVDVEVAGELGEVEAGVGPQLPATVGF
mgnify:CR=1 FL=1